MLLMAPNEARDRLGQGVFLTPCENNPGGRIDSCLAAAVAAEPVERKFLKALKTKDIKPGLQALADEGVREGWITVEERKQRKNCARSRWTRSPWTISAMHSLRAASYYDLPQNKRQPREAA